MEREEYNRDTNPYPSFGKKYNSERAIISLTSWTARINTVSKTLFSLIKQCPGFHIVLVLSEEEFPKMMDELPDNLKLFVDNELIEVLWVYKNYRSFKKWIFTSQKYPNVPIISADDDCIYTCNYAQELYDEWIKNDKNADITMCLNKIYDFSVAWGFATLHNYIELKPIIHVIINLLKQNNTHDDLLYAVISHKLGRHIISLNKNLKNVATLHDENAAIHITYKNKRNTEYLKDIFNAFAK